MSDNNIKSFFPGGNTYRGFHSLFDYIITNPNRIYIIKGGPGTGKSTLLKKLVQEFSNQKLYVERFYCSSDSESLDGFALPKWGIAVLDGTAPHVIDPEKPGAVDEIIDLGRFWNESFLRSKIAEISDIKSKVRTHFNMAYNYLFQAKASKDRLFLLRQEFNQHKNHTMSIESHILKKSIIEGCSGKHKQSNKYKQSSLSNSSAFLRTRYLFATALTPEGHVNMYSDILKDVNHLILIHDNFYPETDQIFKNIHTELKRRGQYFITFLCAFDPDQIDGVYIPETNTACIRYNHYHKVHINNAYTEKINPLKVSGNDTINYLSNEFEASKKQYDSLISSALYHLNEAKKIRAALEKIYSSAQNFEQVELERERVTHEIYQYLKI